ncbi:hypothetical protein Sste5346_005593 [Sporothrix stenoceras]|uniref:Uncharacterized protein n=1 Tax=Sporothrix stenoceras TaxID=5173 RepID=A0ABR3Z2P5_9PEZI
MSGTYIALIVSLGLLTGDAVIELAYITSMVAYLHGGAPSGTFVVNTPATHVANEGSQPTYEIKGKPLHMLVNQGHTSNGAAGSAIVLIGIVGVLALFARARFPGRRFTRFLYNFWMILQIPCFLLTLSALGYTFAVTNKHRNQIINQNVAYASQPGPYALDQWTPQNWFSAVLSQLDLADADLRSNLAHHLRIMRGWQYNLIPLFLLQLAETVLAIVDWRAWKRTGGHNGGQTGCTPSWSANGYNNEKYQGQGDYNNGADPQQYA